MEPNQVSQPVVAMRPMLPAPTVLFKQSYEFYKTHMRTIATIVAIPFGVSVIQALLYRSSAVSSLLSLVFLVVNFLATITLLRMIAGNGVTEGKISDAYSKAGGLLIPFIWFSILSGLATFGGFALLVIPGIYLSVMLSMSTYSFIVDGKRGMSALVQSWNYVKGYWWPVFGRLVFLTVIVLVVTIILGAVFGVSGSSHENYMSHRGGFSSLGMVLNQALSLFVIVPFSLIFSYFLFSSLRAVKAGMPSDDFVRVKNILVTFMIVGGIAVLVLFSLGMFAAVKFGPEFQRYEMRTSLPAAVGISPIFNIFK